MVNKQIISFLKMGIVFLAIIAFYILIASLSGFYSAIRPSKIQNAITPTDFGVKYENVQFKTKDNILIRGWFVPSMKQHAKTIIILHGYPADKSDVLSTRLFLHDKFNLLFFDFRYFGESEGHYTSFGKNEILDLTAAVNYLKKRGINEVGVWGFSMGGATALMTAVHVPEIKAIVAQSSYARLDRMLDIYYPTPWLNKLLAPFIRIWGKIFLHIDVNAISPMDAIKHLKKPVLIIHSRSDTEIPFVHALWLQTALQQNNEAHFLFINNVNHAQLNQEGYIIIKRFFEKYL